jgi:hypothetical protein
MSSSRSLDTASSRERPAISASLFLVGNNVFQVLFALYQFIVFGLQFLFLFG